MSFQGACVDNILIRALPGPATPEDHSDAPRPMSFGERLQFIALFVATIVVAIVASIIFVPVALFGMAKRLLRR
jgi:hypothetical protein